MSALYYLMGKEKVLLILNNLNHKNTVKHELVEWLSARALELAFFLHLNPHSKALFRLQSVQVRWILCALTSLLVEWE